MAVVSSCREVSCQVRQRTRPLLTVATRSRNGSGHTVGTAGDKLEEGGGHGRSVCPESPGPHAGCNGWDNRFRPREGKVIPKPNLSWDRGLQLALVNMESLVIACHHRAVNTVPAPCTHRPSLHPSRVRVRRSLFGHVEPRLGKGGEVVTR
jgi:hypothetical protein